MDLLEEFKDIGQGGPGRLGYRAVYPEDWEWGGERFDSLDILAREPSEAVFLDRGDQPSLERLVTHYGKGIKRLILNRCPRIADLSPLEDLPGLERLGIRWNQRVDRLWDLSKNRSLRGLELDDFVHLHSLEGIQKAPELQHLAYGNRIWGAAVLEGLEPLLETKIGAFGFTGKKIERNDLTVYPRIKTLRQLDVLTNFYTTEQLAWLVARGLEGPVLRAFHHRPNQEGREDVKDVLICGKRKPCLNSIRDAARIRKYEERFEALVAQYRADPEAPPPS